MVTPETKSTNGGRWGRVGVDATDSRRYEVRNDFPYSWLVTGKGGGGMPVLESFRQLVLQFVANWLIYSNPPPAYN
jgi:hypothetical protein